MSIQLCSEAYFFRIEVTNKNLPDGYSENQIFIKVDVNRHWGSLMLITLSCRSIVPNWLQSLVDQCSSLGAVSHRFTYLFINLQNISVFTSFCVLFSFSILPCQSIPWRWFPFLSFQLLLPAFTKFEVLFFFFFQIYTYLFT